MAGQTIEAVQSCGACDQAVAAAARRRDAAKFIPDGSVRELMIRLAQRPECADVAAGVFYAFDWRTRLGPFLFVDTRLVPAGVVTLGSGLVASGFARTRVVLQQWSRYVRPSQSRIDGRSLEMVLISGMQMHSHPMYELIADAWRMGSDRPLILAGGPKAIHQPWHFFNPQGPSADVAVTGELPVLLQLLERLLDYRGRSGTMRQAFERARRDGALLDVPGLVYRIDDGGSDEVELVDTGRQRLLRDLDELPDPLLGYRIMEPPHRGERMADRPLPIDEIRRHAKFLALVSTHGCRFGCPYCPIPDMNHRSFRQKSPSRLRWEIEHLGEQTGIKNFFGTDDNMFNNETAVAEIFKEMAKGRINGVPFRKLIYFGTEATLHDVYRAKEMLPLCRKGGLRAIWFGIEDMTAGLVKKGQSADKVAELFPEMRRMGVWPMPMLMHYEGQPLYTRGSLHGIANQVDFLYRQGAGSVQVTFLTPAVGTKLYDEPFNRGAVAQRVNGMAVEDRFYDGQHVVACDPKTALRHQLQLLGAYAAFYNPVNLLRKVARWYADDKMNLYDASLQVFGMVGWVRSVWMMRRWLWKQWVGPIEPYAGPLRSPWKIRTVEEVLGRAGETVRQYLDTLEPEAAVRRATA